jgi:hypothetical protein
MVAEYTADTVSRCDHEHHQKIGVGNMDLKLDNGTTVTLNLVAERDSVVVTSEIDGKKSTEIIFFQDGRKYVPDAGRFKEM